MSLGAEGGEHATKMRDYCFTAQLTEQFLCNKGRTVLKVMRPCTAETGIFMVRIRNNIEAIN